MDFISAFLGEHGAEGRRDRDTSPWVDLAVEARCKFIHSSYPRTCLKRLTFGSRAVIAAGPDSFWPSSTHIFPSYVIHQSSR
jgi:hypothetical protein